MRPKVIVSDAPRTTIGCTNLLVKDTLVEIDLVGIRK